MWWMNLISSETAEPLVFWCALRVYKPVVSCAYSLLMRANKFETALSRDRLYSLSGPTRYVFFMYIMSVSLSVAKYQISFLRIWWRFCHHAHVVVFLVLTRWAVHNADHSSSGSMLCISHQCQAAILTFIYRHSTQLPLSHANLHHITSDCQRRHCHYILQFKCQTRTICYSLFYWQVFSTLSLCPPMTLTKSRDMPR